MIWAKLLFLSLCAGIADAGFLRLAQKAKLEAQGKRKKMCTGIGSSLCTQNQVSVRSEFSLDGASTIRKLSFGDECATESTVTCRTPKDGPCDSNCGSCPCEYDPSAPLHAHYMQTMFEQLSPWCGEASSQSNVLLIGLGGGELPQYLLHHCPGMNIEAVELNGDVIDLAKRYFGLGEAQAQYPNRLSVQQNDALTAVGQRASSTDGGAYDAVLVDCFKGGGEVPESCRSRDFAENVKAILKPSGLMLQNIWHYSGMNEEVAPEFQEAKATYGDVFQGGLADLSVPMPPQIRWVDILKATKAAQEQ